MADLQVEGPGTTGNPPVNAATLVYVLFAIAVIGTLISHGLIVFAPLVGVAGIVGVIIAYVKRGDAQGTWVASHFTWLIRTFWWSLLWDIIGGTDPGHAGAHPHRHPDRHRHLRGHVDLGHLSADPRLSLLQGQPGRARRVIAARSISGRLPGSGAAGTMGARRFNDSHVAALR